MHGSSSMRIDDVKLVSRGFAHTNQISYATMVETGQFSAPVATTKRGGMYVWQQKFL